MNVRQYVLERLRTLDGRIMDDVAADDLRMLGKDIAKHDELWQLLIMFYPEDAQRYFNDTATQHRAAVVIDYNQRKGVKA